MEQINRIQIKFIKMAKFRLAMTLMVIPLEIRRQKIFFVNFINDSPGRLSQFALVALSCN